MAKLRAEMFLLLTFVAFGTSLIWTGIKIASVGTLLFAVVALLARTLVLLPVLGAAGVKGRDRWIIALSGPRGLSSLLLVLLPVFAGIVGSEDLFAVTCLVVLLSVVLHGGGIALTCEEGREGGRAKWRNEDVELEMPERPDVRARATSPVPIPPSSPLSPRRSRSTRCGRSWPRVHRSSSPTYAPSGAGVRTTSRPKSAIRMPPGDDAVRIAREIGLSHHATVVVDGA